MGGDCERIEPGSYPAIELCVILTTCPDGAIARLISETLINERLAACVTTLDHVTSTYVWQGQLTQQEEVELLIKTTGALREQVFLKVKQVHPYECPQLVAIPVEGASKDYLQWVVTACQ